MSPEGGEGSDLSNRRTTSRDRHGRSSDSLSRERSANPEDPDVDPIDTPGPEANAAPSVTEDVTLRRVLAHYAGLVSASMVGCLIRLGLDALATYNGSVIYSLAWSQGVGCAIMGLSMGLKKEITSLYPPLYTFLTTGVAGSVTTFSSWMLQSYLAFSNFNNVKRSGLHDTVDGLAYSFSTWLIALGGLHVGLHFASMVSSILTICQGRRHRRNPVSEKSLPYKIKRIQTPLMDYFIITSAVISYLIALILYFFAPRAWRHRATFPILLAPPGAIIRFILSKLNPHRPFLDRFPIGTFIANIAATLVVAGVYAAQRQPDTAGASGGMGGLTCDALYAIQQGFCGCLSTVSTFVVESRSISRKRWKWMYIGASVVLGHVCVLGVVGGVGWTKGYVPVCKDLTA